MDNIFEVGIILFLLGDDEWRWSVKRDMILLYSSLIINQLKSFIGKKI